jgi:hypothetical protein
VHTVVWLCRGWLQGLIFLSSRKIASTQDALWAEPTAASQCPTNAATKTPRDLQTMSPLADFLGTLLHEGRAVLRGHPDSTSFHDQDAARVLERAYSSHRLGLAGSLLDFDAAVAQAAAAVVCNACWFLASRNEPESELERLLTFAGPPRSPAEHYSADLVLRFLPQVHRRAKAQNPSDRLTGLVADILRCWPLSGILADLDEAPLTSLDFGGHPGLLMLYAERFALHEKTAWIPSGTALEYFELVYAELGKQCPGQKVAP